MGVFFLRAFTLASSRKGWVNVKTRKKLVMLIKEQNHLRPSHEGLAMGFEVSIVLKPPYFVSIRAMRLKLTSFYYSKNVVLNSLIYFYV